MPSTSRRPRNRRAVLVRGKYKDGPHAGKQRTAEEMWSGAVFELYNILNVKDFQRL